jgi:CheY-like chemotaxis protein
MARSLARHGRSLAWAFSLPDSPPIHRGCPPPCEGSQPADPPGIRVLEDQARLDFVAIDMRMPGCGDSVDVALHARPGFPQIPVTATTVFADNILD